jgi:poly(hydroxyalkanoate) granule-associated protein
MAARRKTGANRTRSAARKGSDVTLVDAVHQIWLAGMGALARAQKEGPRAFESIVVEGASFIDKSRSRAEETLKDAMSTVQTAVTDRMEGTREQAVETWDNLEKIFSGRVQKVLQQVGVPTAKEINALMRRVDELNANVLALGKTQRTAARKAPAKRRGTRKSAAAAA